jgi:hypothetical protein
MSLPVRNGDCSKADEETSLNFPRASEWRVTERKEGGK